MKSVYVLAILAAAVSTSAVAKDLKGDKTDVTRAPVAAGKAMSDADMDKVTAGRAYPDAPGPYLNVDLPGQAYRATGASNGAQAGQAANLY